MTRIVACILLGMGAIGCQPSPTFPDTAQSVLVRIFQPLQPAERIATYEVPLDAALKQAGVGEVSGGGTQWSAPDANWKTSIEWVGIDVELSDFDQGMPILKRELLRLNVPADTKLEYNRHGRDLEEKLP